MNIIIKNVAEDALGETAQKLTEILQHTHRAFANSEVVLSDVEKKVETVVQEVPHEIESAWHKVKVALGLEADTHPDDVLAAAATAAAAQQAAQEAELEAQKKAQEEASAKEGE